MNEFRVVVQMKHEPHVIKVSAKRRFHDSGISKRVDFCLSERMNQKLFFVRMSRSLRLTSST